jgi:hypothetical protein
MGRVVVDHVLPDGHGGILVTPLTQRLGKVQLALRSEALGLRELPCRVPAAGMTAKRGAGTVP